MQNPIRHPQIPCKHLENVQVALPKSGRKAQQSSPPLLIRRRMLKILYPVVFLLKSPKSPKSPGRQKGSAPIEWFLGRDAWL